MKAQVFPSKWILTGLVTSFLVGCGGSSNSSSDSNTVSGTVTAPSGSISYFSEPDSMLVAFAKSILPQAIAEISGLATVANATVELIEVDSEGEEVSVLATTETDASGAFSITLPDNVEYSGQLMLRVIGSGGLELRALVLDDSVDVSPVSEFVVDQLITNGVALNTLDEDVVDDLIEYVNNYDLDATTGLGDLLDALQSTAGTATQELITATESGTGDATSLSGDYRVLDVTFGLHDSDEGIAGSYAVGTTLTELAMAMDGTSLELIISSEMDFSGYMHYGSSLEPNIEFETDLAEDLSIKRQ